MRNLIKQYDELQKTYGSKDLNSVYGCGENSNPRVALVFMNPTKRNIATDKSWKGLRAQWLGTKQIWEFLAKCKLYSTNINEEINHGLFAKNSAIPYPVPLCAPVINTAFAISTS